MQPGQTQPQWKFTASQSQLLTRAVAEVILRDGHHMSMVEGDGFIKLLRIVEPRFVLPSRTFFAQVIVFARCSGLLCNHNIVLCLFICFDISLLFPICIGLPNPYKRLSYMIPVFKFVALCRPRPHPLLLLLLFFFFFSSSHSSFFNIFVAVVSHSTKSLSPSLIHH